MPEGIDYAFGRPSVTALLDAKIKFVCRYLSHSPSKNLTAAEARALSAAGIWIVVVWETTAKRAMTGKPGGTDDAIDALAQAHECGMPDNRPIYFAVDWDASVSQQAAIDAYLDGAASVLGRDRVGIYGGYGAVKRALDAGKSKWAWQTYAWSGGRWDSRARLQQYSNGHTFDGVGCDYDRATTSDYGQWRVGVSPAPQQEVEMLSGKIPAGKAAMDPIVIPAGAFKTLQFGWDNTYTNADLGITRQPPAVFRVAMHQKGRKGTVEQKVTVGAALDDTKGWADNDPTTLPSGCDRIDITRLDDGTRSVGFSVA